MVTEDLAVRFLREKRYVILARNTRVYGPEIDILALNIESNEKNYTFFEVKGVRKANYLSGFPCLSIHQINRYRKAMARLQAKSKKIMNLNMGLLVFDEQGELLEFLPVI